MIRTRGTSGTPDDGHAKSAVDQPPRSGLPKAAQLIVADLCRQIITGDLRGDDSLPSENELMRLYGVSRPTLREALRVLEFEGLLTVRRGARGVPRSTSPLGRRRRVRWRSTLTPRRNICRCDRGSIGHRTCCVRLVAERGKQAHLLRLKQVLASSAHGGSDSTQSSGFHELLVDLAGNQTLTLVYGVLRLVLNESTTGVQLVECTDTRNLAGRRRAHDAHQHLVDLIERKDGDQAEGFWTEHLRGGYIARKPPGATPLNFSGCDRRVRPFWPRGSWL